MKTLTWDGSNPLDRWENPNCRWGDPCFRLEAGDAGYVPWSPPGTTTPPIKTKPKKRNMPKDDPIQRKDADLSAQLLTFKTNIGSFATLVDLSADDVTAQAADADRFAYELQCQDLTRNAAQQLTAWKDLIRLGGDAPVGGAPSAPVFPTPAPAAVPPGVEVRFRALIKRIKSHPNYNPSIGEALGIEGSVLSGPDLATIQPEIEAAIRGDQVFIKWGWGGYAKFLDACEIQVDRGDGHGFVLLAQDTTPGYVDTTPFPATPAEWTYRAIYRVGDGRVGQWSQSASVMVG